MRNVVVATLRGLGFSGQRVAEVLDLSEEYVARLNQRAARYGSAGLVPRRGRPSKLTSAGLARARAWRAEGLSNVEIGRRLRVDNSTISRALSGQAGGLGVAAQPALLDDRTGMDLTDVDDRAEVDPHERADADACADVDAEDRTVDVDDLTVVGAGGQGRVEPDGGAGLYPARVRDGVYESRYAGAMLLHAFCHRIGASSLLAAAMPGGGRYDDVGLLTATMMTFALGADSVEASKHLLPTHVGPLAGLARLAHRNTVRQRLGLLADAVDPLPLQSDLAKAMIDVDAASLGLYFVDEHFVAYEGAKPVAKGWNTKRRHAQKGRHDTVVVDYHARAVCFLSGEPSGLSTTIKAVLANLRQITGPDAKVMLGFDRGGAYPGVFTACRDAKADWLTYRRGKLVQPAAPPRRFWRTGPDSQPEAIWLSDEIVDIDGYGSCRQLTLFENNVPVLQVLTSDTTAPAAALLAWLRCRWRIENAFKYLAAHHGIDWLCDYTAELVDDNRRITNPARQEAKAALAAASNELGQAEQRLAQVLSDRSISIETTNQMIPTMQSKIDKLRHKVTQAEAELATTPAKIAANKLAPGAQRAILNTRKRSLQMVLRLLAYNSESWLAERLNSYLTDRNEYRAITRNLLHLGGTITYAQTKITVALHRPTTPRVTRALTLLLDELNTTPPHVPGDHRPITYCVQP